MAFISLRQLLDHAAEFGYGVPAFNINNMEQVQAIMLAAAETDSPAILQASAGARGYAGEPFLRHIAQAAVETWPQIPLVMHQDHGASPAVCQASIRSGFTSVMMDGSLREDMKTPASYEYNVEVTGRVADMAHAVGVSVEGELGCLGSLESGAAGEEDGVGAEGTLTREQMLTDPTQAADFVERTAVDALAIAIGTSHGAYKFSRQPTREVLAIARIEGDSPRDSQHTPGHARLLFRSPGVAGRAAPIRRRHSRDLWCPGRGDPGRYPPRRSQGQHRYRYPYYDTAAVRRSLVGSPADFDPRKFLKAATAGAREICKARFEAFGCSGQAARIRSLALEKMAERYGRREQLRRVG